ncbi:MAG: hypothetical protein GF334_03970 [Candidatus Altiarchaeales archaeon]|nr:hypothetical protein [Candidatus Altiarchaeales archaeon]
MISDRETQKLHTLSGSSGRYSEIIKLRYGPDYGSGFLGLFQALFQGRLIEVIRDPGPPYVAEKDIPLIARTLCNLAEGIGKSSSIHPSYRKYMSKSKESNVSTDSLFE